MNQNDDNNNALNNINDCIKVITPMNWIASIRRLDILNDVLELSLLNHDDNINNNTHNHGNAEVHTDNAIGEVLAQMLNDTDTSIQRVTTCMNKHGEPSNSIDTNGHHVWSNIQTKVRKNRLPLLTHIHEKSKKPPLFILECNTTNITTINSYDDTTIGEDWNLISNNKTDKIRGKLIDGGANAGITGNLTSNNRRDTIMKAVIDGSANGGIAGTEDSQQLNATFNCGKSVKVTKVGESTL